MNMHFLHLEYVDNTDFLCWLELNHLNTQKYQVNMHSECLWLKGWRTEKLDHEQHQNSGDKHFGSCDGLSVWVYHLAKLNPSYSVKN